MLINNCTAFVRHNFLLTLEHFCGYTTACISWTSSSKQFPSTQGAFVERIERFSCRPLIEMLWHGSEPVDPTKNKCGNHFTNCWVGEQPNFYWLICTKAVTWHLSLGNTQIVDVIPSTLTFLWAPFSVQCRCWTSLTNGLSLHWESWHVHNWNAV